MSKNYGRRTWKMVKAKSRSSALKKGREIARNDGYTAKRMTAKELKGKGIFSGTGKNYSVSYIQSKRK